MINGAPKVNSSFPSLVDDIHWGAARGGETNSKVESEVNKIVAEANGSSSDADELKSFLSQFLQGFKTEWDNYTAYLDSENTKQRNWLEDMAEKSFQRELDAQSTAYTREFESMREAGLNPYAYFLNGGSSNFTTPKYSVNSTSYATASRPQGLDNAFQLFLKQLETYSNTAYRSDMTELEKEKLELQKAHMIMDMAATYMAASAQMAKSTSYGNV